MGEAKLVSFALKVELATPTRQETYQRQSRTRSAELGGTAGSKGRFYTVVLKPDIIWNYRLDEEGRAESELLVPARISAISSAQSIGLTR